MLVVTTIANAIDFDVQQTHKNITARGAKLWPAGPARPAVEAVTGRVCVAVGCAPFVVGKSIAIPL